MMKLIIVAICLMAVQGNQELSSLSGELLEWAQSLKGSDKVEDVQGVVDAIINSLVEAGDNATLTEFIEAMEDSRAGVDKREQTLNAGKQGHCCLGGKLEVTYHDKDITVPSYHSTQNDKNYGSKSCGTFGWNRCATETITNTKVYYESKKVTVKVPVWTCGVENAVCCHGYVTITKIPGGLAEVGENNCVESKKALFTIIQLQLFEKVSEGKVILSANQMDKILNAVATFFTSNGVQAGEEQP